MLEFRKITQKDYPELVKWWKQNKFSAIPRTALPNNGEGGIMVFKDDVNICAGFLYNTNSSLCWIEFIVANFDVKDRELRKESLNLLIKQLCESARLMNKTAAFTSVKHPSLIQRYTDNGFSTGSDGTTEMIKAL